MSASATTKESKLRNLLASVLYRSESADSPLLRDESERPTIRAPLIQSFQNVPIEELHGLKSAENCFYLDDVSTSFLDRMFYSKEKLTEIKEFKEAEMRNKQRQGEHHSSKSSLFYYIRGNDRAYIREGIDHPKLLSLIDDRDAVGANVIHVAYLLGHHKLGRMLVKKFPDVAVKPYEKEFNKNKLPYEGENILHISIVHKLVDHKSIDEVKWLLDFFSSRSDQKKNLDELLNSRAVGSFFKLTPRSYFGEIPLHFAACTNSKKMFDCVLGYVPEGVDRIRYLLRRDQHGNTLLHICVLKKLQRMYSHVRDIFKEQLTKYIHDSPEQAALELSAVVPSAEVEGVVDSTYAKTLNRYKLTQMHYPEEHELDDAKRKLWIAEQVTIKEGELLTNVLNNDGHTTLTLAAEAGDAEMLKFLLDDRMKKCERYNYGPITVSLIDLEGLDQPIDFSMHTLSDRNNVMKYSAIEWLSLNVNSTSDRVREQMRERLDPFAIPVIVDLIQTKWDKIGKIRLYRSACFTLLTTLLITIISVVNEYGTYNIETDQDKFIIFLYMITGSLLMVRFLSTLPSLLYYRFEYWGLSGRKNAVRGASRLDRICGDVIVVSFTSYMISKGVAANLIPNYTQYDRSYFEQPVRYSMMICVMFSWFNLYYFMMAFEKTGPLVIVMYKIMTQSVGFFLQFYILVVFGIGCALVLITNDGSHDMGRNLLFLIEVWWGLIKLTAGFKDSYADEFVPPGMEWSYELLTTSFSILVTILILNLLIASANDLFSKYVDLADKMYLLEQFNIMYAFDRNSRANIDFLKAVSTIMPSVDKALKTYVDKALQFDLSKYAVEEKLPDGKSAWFHKMETINKSWWMSEEDPKIQASNDKLEKSRIEEDPEIQASNDKLKSRIEVMEAIIVDLKSQLT